MPPKPSWEQVSKLFGKALEYPRGERSVWLDKACGGDAELRREVEALLQGHQRADGVLDRGVQEFAADAISLSQKGFPEGHEIGPYRILAEIGRGGMGVVYKAHDTRLERTVALKFLAPYFASPRDRERFTREAKAAAALHHPNICTVYEIHDFGTDIAIAMAYIEGETLTANLKSGPLPVAECLDIACQLTDALRVSHASGIVHRDIKPSNVMVTPGEGPSNRVTIMDFGLAQLMGRSKLTRTGTIVGTPKYMSPEQIQSRPTDQRTDVWSVGVVLYEMLAGEPPFSEERNPEITRAIVHEDSEPISGLRRGIPAELEWVVEKAMAKDPAERYQRIDEMLVDLRVVRKREESGIWKRRLPRLEDEDGNGRGAGREAASGANRAALPWKIAFAVSTLVAAGALLALFLTR